VVTLNNETSPDGTTSAAKVVLDVGGGTTSGDRSLFLVPTANVTATNSYAGSVWLKGAVGGERVVMRHAGNATYSLFTLTTSWARYDVTETAASSLATMAIGLKGNQSDATATIYVWGAQIEAGDFPTSFIKTTGSTASRSADVASIDVDQFGFNANEGSVVVEVGAHNTDSNAAAHYTLSKTTIGSEWVSAYSSGTNVAFRVREGGSDQGVITISDDIRASGAKTGFAFKANDFAAVVDGGTVSTDTSGSMASGIEELKIASFGSNPRQLCGHIKSINYYPKRLSNAKLQELTS
jgi:hypothetical protein